MQVNNVNLVAAQQMSNNNYVWREILLCFDYSSHYVLVCSHYVLPASASVFVFFILLRGLQWVEFPFFFNLVSWTGNYQKKNGPGSWSLGKIGREIGVGQHLGRQMGFVLLSPH